uniref:Oxidoreductase n=1 Tax=Rhabditophanes sp. KR3021 TaxID=114890 RepID=A0AC35TL83_9BILA
MSRFTDKVVIITGGGSGIGLGAALKFADENAKVVITGRSENKLKDAIEEMKKTGAKDQNLFYIVSDVSTEEDAKRVVNETIKKFGKIDILLNNAGVVSNPDCNNLQHIQTYDYVFSINVRGVILLSSEAIPHLIKTKGNIVNVSSIAPFYATANATYYAMSKADQAYEWGGSGIGLGAALKFADENAKVVITGRSENKLKDAIEEMKKTGAKDQNLFYIVSDVSTEEDAKRVVNETIKKFGKIDVLLNNAGVVSNPDCNNLQHIQTYDYVFSINVRGVILLSSEAIPHLIKTKGNIVNVSSIAPFYATANATYYAMSKAALNSYTVSLAGKLAKDGVRANLINPGLVRTPIFMQVKSEDGSKMTDESLSEVDEFCKKSVPMGRFGTPAEIANHILFLASDQASFVTGSINISDGGYSVRSACTVSHYDNILV